MVVQLHARAERTKPVQLRRRRARLPLEVEVGEVVRHLHPSVAALQRLPHELRVVPLDDDVLEGRGKRLGKRTLRISCGPFIPGELVVNLRKQLARKIKYLCLVLVSALRGLSEVIPACFICVDCFSCKHVPLFRLPPFSWLLRLSVVNFDARASSVFLVGSAPYSAYLERALSWPGLGLL